MQDRANRDYGLMDLQDELAIHELLSRVSHITDEGAYDRLAEVYTEDVVSDASAVGFGVNRGIAQIASVWGGRARRAAGHFATNFLLTPVDAKTVRAVSKGLSVYYDPLDVRLVVHHDLIVRTAAGWRIQNRVTVRPGAMGAGGVPPAR